jgi:hypothetical protein
VPVLDSGQIAAEEAGTFFDVSLRKAFLQAIASDSYSNFHSGGLTDRTFPCVQQGRNFKILSA